MKPNIILITIDSLRADHVSCYGYKRKTTPNIDKLGNQATIYKNAYANGPNTPNSFPSIMFSRYILESENFIIPKYWQSIAGVLKKNGYYTIGLNSGNSLISKFFGYGKGFDIFKSYLNYSFEWDDKKLIKILEGRKSTKKTKIQKSKIMNLITRIVKFIEDIIIFDFTKKKITLDQKFSLDAVNTISNLKSPFFIWIHFMDVHFPYVPQKRFRVFGKTKSISHMGLRILNYFVRFNWNCNKKIIRKIISIYDGSILQVDEFIGKILSSLKQNKKFNNSMVVLTSDHGECFKEHGNFYHYTYDAYNELLRVPLVIKYPHQKSSNTINNKVSLINLLPTITDNINIDNQRIVKGKPLPKFNEINKEVIYAEGYDLLDVSEIITKSIKLKPRIYSVISNNRKIIIDNHNNRNMLFNLSNDPNEEHNLIGKEKNNLLKLTKKLDDHISKERKIMNFEKTIHKNSVLIQKRM
jgi:arylsulfatase A-like enzyme